MEAAGGLYPVAEIGLESISDVSTAIPTNHRNDMRNI